MPKSRVTAEPEPTYPPPLRERLIIVDDFLPPDLAERMREAIDTHFSNPSAHQADVHQVWNYWFVPELYTYLRTAPEKVIDRAAVDGFVERLRVWSVETLGLGRVSWPYLSLYVNGCRQGLHNDSANGRFGFVYSLTRDERRTTGGETIVHREGDPFRAKMATPSAGRGFYDLVPPRFNRLVIFDDRMPHAVEMVQGSMDPVEGRFVLHGHISEAGALVSGALPLEVAGPPATAVARAVLGPAAGALEAYHGPLTLRLEIAPDGSVANARAVLDRVIHPDPRDPAWPPLLDALLSGMRDLSFPTADGPTQLTLPIAFGKIPANR